MLRKNRVISDIFKTFPAQWITAMALLTSAHSAQALTADDVLNKMETKERSTFLAGMIGGFAYARYLRDRPEEDGMNCIYHWYYEQPEKSENQIEQWLSRHLDKPIEPLIYVLLKKECGE